MLTATRARRVVAASTCAAALVASLSACGGGDDKVATPPTHTAGPTPPTSTTSGPATTAPTPLPTSTPIATGPVPLAAHTVYRYGGLTFVVNLPAEVPIDSLPRMRPFSEFLQAIGRTTAQNKLDPALARLASAEIVKYVQTFVEPGSVQGVGTIVISVTKAETLAPGPTQITGCLVSRLVQVRKNGSRYLDPVTKKYPTLKMTATVSPQSAVQPVAQFAFAAGPC